MVLCVGRVPMVVVWLKPSCRWLAPSSGWPLETVGAWREEGEREARWEGREREAALGSSPPPSLGSSPLPSLGSSPHLPGTLGLITGASAGEQTLGGHSRPEAVRTTRRRGDGGGPRRRRRAAFSRFDLPQLLLLKSTCELARRRGWECSRAACASARGARSLSRGHGGSGEYLAARTISRCIMRCP